MALVKASNVKKPKPTGALAKALHEEMKASSGVVLPILKQHLASRPADESRRADCIHPSELVHGDWCSRKVYWRIEGKVGSEPKRHSLTTEMIFDEGHTIHDKYQRLLWEAGVLFGKWECLACEKVWFAQSPKLCVGCGAVKKLIRYREVPIDDDDYLLHGHADGIIDTMHGPVLLEAKSVGFGTVRVLAPRLHRQYEQGEITATQLWRDIKRPFLSHVKQGVLYAWVKQLKYVAILYECKWNGQQKEWLIPVDRALIDELLEECLDVRWALDKKKTPVTPVWASATHSSCKECPYHAACWESK